MNENRQINRTMDSFKHDNFLIATVSVGGKVDLLHLASKIASIFIL